MKKIKTYSVVVACFALVGAASAALLTTDFDSHAVGSADTNSLNAVTTGGTWSLISDTDVTKTVEAATNYVSDRALLLDYAIAKGSSPTQEWGRVTLDAAADFSASAVTVSFSTAIRRNGSNRAYKYRLLDDSGAEVASVLWDVDLNVVTFSDGTTNALSEIFTNPWNPDNAVTFSAVLDSGTYTLNFGGLSSGPIATSATTLGSISFLNQTGPYTTQNRYAGFYLDQIEVVNSTTPSGVNVQIAASLSGVTLTFDSVVDSAYDVLRVIQLGDEWQSVTNVTATGTSTSVDVPYPDPSNKTGFFRVQSL